MKDLEHNNFPVRKKMKRKDLNLSAKELGKAIKIIRKLPEGFCMNLGRKIFKEREHLHYTNVSVFIKFVCKVQEKTIEILPKLLSALH